MLLGGFVLLFGLGVFSIWRRPVTAGVDMGAAPPPPSLPAKRKKAAAPASPAPPVQVAPTPSPAASEAPAANSAATVAAVEREVEQGLDGLKDKLFRLELRRQAGTVTEEEYLRERTQAEKDPARTGRALSRQRDHWRETDLPSKHWCRVPAGRKALRRAICPARGFLADCSGRVGWPGGRKRFRQDHAAEDGGASDPSQRGQGGILQREWNRRKRSGPGRAQHAVVRRPDRRGESVALRATV